MTVHCLVVEEGAHQIPNGPKIEAKSYESTVTDGKGNWNGEEQSYNHTYTEPPVVVGQVMTFNDVNWSVFWSRSASSKNSPPGAGGLRTGKHIGEDTETARATEMIGFIVMEAGNGVTPFQFEAKLGTDTVRGIDNAASNSYSYSYTQSFGSIPEVIVVSLAGMDGNDGGWAVLSEVGQSATSLQVVVDEDQISNGERRHTTEQVAYIALQNAGNITLT